MDCIPLVLRSAYEEIHCEPTACEESVEKKEHTCCCFSCGYSAILNGDSQDNHASRLSSSGKEHERSSSHPINEENRNDAREEILDSVESSKK
jgi:hypothetical protein